MRVYYYAIRTCGAVAHGRPRQLSESGGTPPEAATGAAVPRAYPYRRAWHALLRYSDVSDSGARLIVDEEGELPDKFILLLNKSGEARRVCRLVWRDGKTLGVEFS